MHNGVKLFMDSQPNFIDYFDLLNVAFCQKINAAHKNVPNHYSEQAVLNLVIIKHNKISKFLLRVVIWHIYLCCIEVSDKKLHLKPVMHTIS